MIVTGDSCVYSSSSTHVGDDEAQAVGQFVTDIVVTN